MTFRLIVRPGAEDYITEAAIWYESREVGLGLEVIEEIHAAIERSNTPLAYLRLRENPHVRRALTQRFPYRVFLCREIGRSSARCAS